MSQVEDQVEWYAGVGGRGTLSNAPAQRTPQRNGRLAQLSLEALVGEFVLGVAFRFDDLFEIRRTVARTGRFFRPAIFARLASSNLARYARFLGQFPKIVVFVWHAAIPEKGLVSYLRWRTSSVPSAQSRPPPARRRIYKMLCVLYPCTPTHGGCQAEKVKYSANLRHGL